MRKKSISIIGAGIGGLATGCYAQMNGFSSQIFEQHDKSGGLAATWTRGDYIIDGGIYFLSGHKPDIAFYNILKEIGVNFDDLVDMNTYIRFIDEKSSTRVDITDDLNELRKDFLRLFPEDEEIINELISLTKKISKTDISTLGYERPIEIQTRLNSLKDFWKARKIWRLFIGKNRLSVRNRVKSTHNKLLGEILMKIFLPDVPYWFISMILSLLTSKQMCLPTKGAYEFVRSIEDHYICLGGEIHHNSDVKKILVDENKTVGIQLLNGDQVYSDYVISAADGYHTIFHLLQGLYVDETIINRYKSIKISPSIVLISFGVAREYKDNSWLTFLQLNDPIKFHNNTINDLSIRTFNYSPHFAPSGKTVVQAMFETDWEFWHALRQEPLEYEELKEEIAKEVLGRLENHFPEISTSTEVIDVSTPITFWRYTRSHKGSIMGLYPSSKNMMVQPKKTLPGLSNFYLAGHWAMSVGGVSSAIFSGRHAIQLVCKKESTKFSTTKQHRLEF
ncbi:MAG: phytoene desaturase family protein [Candidatus Kariarchaeaceae archaeon]|jgi:phytoene dehydrogenase-like protein